MRTEEKNIFGAVTVVVNPDCSDRRLVLQLSPSKAELAVGCESPSRDLKVAIRLKRVEAIELRDMLNQLVEYMRDKEPEEGSKEERKIMREMLVNMVEGLRK